MDRFLEFVASHYILAGLLVAFVIAFIYTELARGGKSVTPQALTGLVNTKNARIIDIRDAAEFKQGHIAGSENIPFARMTERLDELKKDPARPIVIVCKIGQSAGAISGQLKTAGLAEVYKLEGGISNWKAQSLPLVRK